jgi:hypothetical protein
MTSAVVNRLDRPTLDIGLGVHLAQKLINRLSHRMAPMADADSGLGVHFVICNRGLS